jgi:hypothetical protein
VTQESICPHALDGSEELALTGYGGMTNCVHRGKHTMETALLDSMGDLIGRESAFPEFIE